MTREFKLTKTQKNDLLADGYHKSDLLQIEQGVNLGIFTHNKNKKEKAITWEKALDILGEDKFLSGISRASFHWNCCRYIDDNKQDEFVYFDFSKLFK